MATYLISSISVTTQQFMAVAPRAGQLKDDQEQSVTAHEAQESSAWALHYASRMWWTMSSWLRRPRT